jgi:hypothetical protein
MVMFVLSACVGCQQIISYNPNKVPSLSVNGNREPICKKCFNKWNEIHRTSKGLEAVYLHPEAYSATREV